MKVAIVKTDNVLDLVDRIRQLKSLPLRERIEAVNTLLTVIDAVKVANEHDLLCPTCAKDLRGVDKSTLYRSAQRGNLTLFTICHNDFYSRKEILAMKPRKNSGGWNRGLPQSVTHPDGNGCRKRIE